jgi:hypothetical protein
LEALLNNWETILIPTLEEVQRIELLENVGTLANRCFQELKVQKAKRKFNRRSDDKVYELLGKFLSVVSAQAKQAVKKYVDAQSVPNELMVKMIREEMKPVVDELYWVWHEIDKHKQEIKDFAKNAKESAKKAADNTEEVITKVTEAKQEAIAAKEAADAIKTTADNMLPNMLSVLGILVGIVVAVVGCYLSILLAEHSSDIKSFIGYSRPFEFARYLLMGHITTMVVFLLMYLISRISGYTLSCSCNRFDPVAGYKTPDIHDCSKCTMKCGVQKRFVWRYPYLFGINFACCIGYVVLAIWQFINVYFRVSLDNWIISLGFWRCLRELIVLILLLTVATVTVVAIIVFAYQLIKWMLSLMKS